MGAFVRSVLMLTGISVAAQADPREPFEAPEARAAFDAWQALAGRRDAARVPLLAALDAVRACKARGACRTVRARLRAEERRYREYLVAVLEVQQQAVFRMYAWAERFEAEARELEASETCASTGGSPAADRIAQRFEAWAGALEAAVDRNAPATAAARDVVEASRRYRAALRTPGPSGRSAADAVASAVGFQIFAAEVMAYLSLSVENELLELGVIAQPSELDQDIERE